jgi:hypothetical protein
MLSLVGDLVGNPVESHCWKKVGVQPHYRFSRGRPDRKWGEGLFTIGYRSMSLLLSTSLSLSLFLKKGSGVACLLAT